MQGLDQLDVWARRHAQARDWVLVENRHNPTTVHLRTLVTDRYKITVYRDAELRRAVRPGKTIPASCTTAGTTRPTPRSRRSCLLRFVQAEIQREPTRMPRIAGA